MLHSFLKAGIFWTGILLSLSCYGQRDLSRGNRPNEPLGALPMQYIGSFAGETGAPRVTLYNYYGWSNISYSPYQDIFQSVLSYDQFIPALHTGIGFSTHQGIGRTANVILEDGQRFPASRIRNQYYELNLAPKFSIKGKYTLSPSITLNYRKSKNLDIGYNGLIGFGSRAGIMWNAPKYYIGFSMNGITAYYNNTGEKAPNRLYSYLQAGYAFQKSSDANFSVTPQLVLLVNTPYGKQRGRFFYKNNLDRYVEAFNLNFRYKQFIWGVNNAGIHLGFQNERLRLMMTNDSGYFGDGNFRRSRLTYPSGTKLYEGNLSLRYVFK